MKKGFLIFLTLCMLIGCKKDDQQQIVNGTYTGEFIVTLGAEKTTSAFELTITDGQYKSTRGLGTFQLKKEQIVQFKDVNVWPAIIDGATILSGDYSYLLDGDQLTLVKVFEPVEHPEYTLMMAMKYEYRLTRRE